MSRLVSWEMIFSDLKQRAPATAAETEEWYPCEVLTITLKLKNGRRMRYDYRTKDLYFVDPKDIDDLYDLTRKEWNKEFGKNLKRLMRLKGLKQRDLCEISGVSQEAISNYMYGKTIPNLYFSAKIARALECSLLDLIDFKH